MTQCPRLLGTACQFCDAFDLDPCPLTEPLPAHLTGAAVTAGTTGVCSVDNETCESCQ